jgi:hypothetical protein
VTRYAPLWVQEPDYPATVDRRLIGALWPGMRSTGLAVSAQGGGMVLNIAEGSGAIPTVNSSGSVLCVSDSVEQIELVAPGPTGQNRFDLVVMVPRSDDIGAPGAGDFIFTSLTGVYGGGPPNAPLGMMPLAQVSVPGGSVTIAPGNIVDLRPGYLSVPAIDPSLPRGFVASAQGPLTQITPAARTSVVTLTVAMQAGRRYKVSGYSRGSSAAASNNSIWYFVDPVNGQQEIGGFVNAIANVWASGHMAACFINATTAGDRVFSIDAFPSPASGFNIPANSARLLAEDIGAL